MNKYERRLWRRRLDREREEILNSTRYHPGQYDDSRFVTPPSGFPTDTKIFNEKSVVRDFRPGDFLHTTPYVAQFVEEHGCAYIAYEVRYNTNGNLRAKSAARNVNSGGMAFSSRSPSKWSALQTNAQRALNNKVLEGVPTWDILTDLGESSELISSLRRFTHSLAEISEGIIARNPHRILRGFGVRPLKRRIRHVNRVLLETRYGNENGNNVFDAAARLWMSYRYGLMPTVYSIDDCYKTLISSNWYDNCKYEFQVTLKDSIAESARSTIPAYSYQVGHDRCSFASYEASVRMKAYVSYATGLKTRLSACNYVSLLRTTYELTRLSYVLDWFVDIGGSLNELMLPSLVAESAVNVSLQQHTRINRWVENIKPASGYYLVPVYAPGYIQRYDQFIFERQVGSLTVVPPYVDWGLTTFQRQLDSVALLWNKFKPRYHH